MGFERRASADHANGPNISYFTLVPAHPSGTTHQDAVPRSAGAATFVIHSMARCRAALEQLGRLTPDTTERMARFSRGIGGISANGRYKRRLGFGRTITWKLIRAEQCLVNGGPRSNCGSEKLVLVSKTPKPRWRDVVRRYRDTCPDWYAELQREEHRLYWIMTHGEDIDDCYMQEWIESAEESTPETPSSVPLETQPFLPSLTLVSTYDGNPFLTS